MEKCCQVNYNVFLHFLFSLPEIYNMKCLVWIDSDMEVHVMVVDVLLSNAKVVYMC